MSDEEKKIETQEETKIEAQETEETKIEEQAPAQEEPQVEAPKEEVKDEPIIIEDNTAVPPVQPIQDLPRTAKLKEPMSKEKKITIIVVSVVAFIALFSILFFPLYFCYFQGRIHVYDADDFVAAAGKRFVIEKDITVNGDLDLSASSCSIDLQGHTVTVNGTLKLGSTDSNISVGTLKKGSYTAAGLLSAKNLVVANEKANININSALIVKDTLDITAKSVTLNNVSTVTSATFNVGSLTVKGPYTVSSDDTALTLINTKATFFKEIAAAKVNVTNSEVVLNAQVNAKAFALDADSTLQCYGKIKSVEGGKKVAMLKGHSCETYTDVNVLAIYDAFNQTYSATGCDTIVYLETLPTPVDFIVSEEGGVFKAICAKVDKYDGVKYKFYLDTKEYDSATNEVDITEDLKKAGAATHKLQAYALGNYDFATLDTQALASGTTLYLDCDSPATLSYSYTLKLSTPKNVAMDNYDSKTYIKFSDIEFADYYLVTIDGNKKIILTDLTKAEFLSNKERASVASKYGNNVEQYQDTVFVGLHAADLSSYLETLGYHSLRIVACSFEKEIETSKEAMTSYKTTKKIALTAANISATSTQNNDGTYTNTITIENCEEGKVFVITVGSDVIRISNSNTYTFTTSTSMVGESCTVQAEAYGYYTASDLQAKIFA